jgi:hypothetical protein
VFVFFSLPCLFVEEIGRSLAKAKLRSSSHFIARRKRCTTEGAVSSSGSAFLFVVQADGSGGEGQDGGAEVEPC